MKNNFLSYILKILMDLTKWRIQVIRKPTWLFIFSNP